jgi:hypothetical protein
LNRRGARTGAKPKTTIPAEFEIRGIDKIATWANAGER